MTEETNSTKVEEPTMLEMAAGALLGFAILLLALAVITST
jgi:hypothetical protein